MRLRELILIAVLIVISGTALLAQDEAALKQRIQGRADAVAELVSSGLVQEGSKGLLVASGQLTPQQSTTMQDENKDREAVFAVIAKKSGITPADVAQMYAKRASKGAAPVSAGFGPCKLTPAKVADVARLLQYLKQGMNYASQKKYDLALAEFQPALAIDKNFLGLNQNVGSAQLSLKKFSEAENAFKAELKLADCLSPLNDAQLSNFAYFIEVDEKDPAKRKKEQSDKLKAQIPVIKGTAHYNLACVYSTQKQKDAALTELRAAVDAGFSDKKALSSDPDLAFVRSTPEFRDILSKVH